MFIICNLDHWHHRLLSDVLAIDKLNSGFWLAGELQAMSSIGACPADEVLAPSYFVDQGIFRRPGYSAINRMLCTLHTWLYFQIWYVTWDLVITSCQAVAYNPGVGCALTLMGLHRCPVRCPGHSTRQYSNQTLRGASRKWFSTCPCMHARKASCCASCTFIMLHCRREET